MLYGEITPTLGKNKAGESAIFFDMTADRFEFPNVGNSGGTQSDEATSDANFGKFKKNEEAAAAAPAPAGTTAADPADDLPF